MRLHLLVVKGKEEMHFYDVGTREHHGWPRKTGEKARFLEDFLVDYDVVKILEVGEEYYRCAPAVPPKKKALKIYTS